jgi:UDP-N-acetylmuramoyl-L-alanyl-D-glutamate--2,6-diaminopimelate ligase
VNLIDFIKTYSDFELVSDSRKADSRSIFVAQKGSSIDSHSFLSNVYDQGCRHFIVEDDKDLKSFKDIQVLKVSNSKKAWAEAWKFRSENPDQNLLVIGVTGTNGKTSITMMLEHILNSIQKPCGVMGTIDHHLQTNDHYKIWPTSLTTPGSEVLFPRLQEMKSTGAKAVALEISSHALDQNRAEGLDLDVAIFSNLTEDHLDYHKSFEHYFESKVMLFENLLLNSSKKQKVSVLNYNDPWIQKYLPDFGTVEILIEVADLKKLNTDSEFNAILKLIQNKNFSKSSNKNNTQNSNANVKINLVQIINHTVQGLKFELLFDYKMNTGGTEANTIVFELPVMGHFQVLNWCQAVLACKHLEISKKDWVTIASKFYGVPGRLQKVLGSNQKSVFVDYAHTPDALERTLKSLKDICKSETKNLSKTNSTDNSNAKIIAVFGCGGDRDKAKRPLMGRVTERWADVQIITNDNPRSEDPEQIAQDILSGFINTKPKIELDRKKAILMGIQLLKSPHDILLIAGKGHENYQILKDKTIDFSDYKVAEEAINSSEISS